MTRREFELTCGPPKLVVRRLQYWSKVLSPSIDGSV